MKTDQSLKNDFVKIEGKYESSNNIRKSTKEPSDLIQEDQFKNEFMNLYNSEKRNSEVENDGINLKTLNTIFRKIRHRELTDTSPLFIIK